MNDLRRINKHYETVNGRLKKGDILIGCLETFSARKERIWINKVPFLRNFYFSFEFLFKRIMPKLNFSKTLYFDITEGRDRLLSKAEGLGRLVSCGFSIVDFRSINGLIYFVVKKTSSPEYNPNPSYGPLYAMPRIGKNGKIIKVLKMRTMHPFSEYLQDYIVKANGYAESGKPANDFRIPKWGKVMRKFWLDELPQIINFLKGDLKLVGVRPVSESYFNDIPKEMQKLRSSQKPGCIPPYVSLNKPGNVMSVLQSEKQYLDEKIKDPYFTDTKYFFKAIFNIVVKRKRSA
jgi:lipopolysaccharide/colanic/teichoic acid biosynthesis glycosyltransferase